MTNQAAEIQEPFERRALLLQLGDVLETMFCLSQCADEYASIGDAVRGNDALAGFTLLGFVDARMPGNVPRSVQKVRRQEDAEGRGGRGVS